MKHLVGLVGVCGRELVAWLGTMNEWTLVLLVGALALDHALARRVRASWRIALYAPLGLRVLLPQCWALSVARAPRVVTLLTPVPIDLSPPVEMVHAGPSLEWPVAAVVVYTVVALFLATAITRRRIRASRVLRASRPVSGALTLLPLPCPLLEHAELGPMVVGLVSPCIVVPSQLLAKGDAFAIASVLRHESAHLARRDTWLSAAMQLALIVLWPVLPLWVASWRIRQLMEIACDEGALDAADANERRHYGHALLDLAEWRSIALTPMAAELHFGSTLRARIEALAWTSRWSLVTQGSLVALAVGGFAACSAVGPNSSQTETASRTQGLTWSPPPGGVLRDFDDLQANCSPFFAATRGSGDDWWTRWVSQVVADGLPPDQVALCRYPKIMLEGLGSEDWAKEARHTLGQIGLDFVRAYEVRWSTRQLCPSGPPVPRQLQPPDGKYQPQDSDWNEGGWQCLLFAMDRPMSFQYELRTSSNGFVATAHGQHIAEGRVVDVTMALRGEVQGVQLHVAPKIEETWAVRP
jgi:beta-lactamase regulating signal transducer with metallopeptidase domain